MSANDIGQTNFYSPAGAYQGTNTATPQANTTTNTPRQAPQATAMKGW